MDVNGYVIEPGADLSGADLSNTKLLGLSFDGVILHGVNFKRADLEGADFKNAVVGGGWDIIELDICTYGPRFDGANLKDSDFSSACLYFTSFCGADVRGTNFSGVSFKFCYNPIADALDEGPDFTDAIYDQSTIWPDGEIPDGAISKQAE